MMISSELKNKNNKINLNTLIFLDFNTNLIRYDFKCI